MHHRLDEFARGKGFADYQDAIAQLDARFGRDDDSIRRLQFEGLETTADTAKDAANLYLQAATSRLPISTKCVTIATKAEGAAAKEGQMLYRGVPGNGTQKATLAQQGVATPRGTALDEASLMKHVLGEDVSAGVTSWTTERGVAARFSGTDGTIIEVPLSKVADQIVPRPPVPKYGGESELLLKGTIQGTPTKP